jgi:hypothetical protein
MIKLKNETKWTQLFSLILISIGLLLGCEQIMTAESDYQKTDYTMSGNDLEACDQLSQVSVQIDTANGLRKFGPQWNVNNIETKALLRSERIGNSWINEDVEVAADLFVVVDADTNYGAFAILSARVSQVEGSGELVADSIIIIYKYLAKPAVNFDTVTADTVLIEYASESIFYLDLENGLVSASGNWTLRFNASNIALNTDIRVARIEKKAFADLHAVPNKVFIGDGLGIDAAIAYLETYNNYYLDTDSTYQVKIVSSEATGYMLFDCTDLGENSYSIYTTDYMDIKLFDTDGIGVNASSEAISTVTIANCADIKTKEIYKLAAQKYLVQFRPSQQMVTNIFNVAILLGGE